MKIPRDLSGREIVKALRKHWDYRQVHQEGSHIILRLVATHKGVDKQDVLASF